MDAMRKHGVVVVVAEKNEPKGVEAALVVKCWISDDYERECERQKEKETSAFL